MASAMRSEDEDLTSALSCKDIILQTVAKSEGHFKSQQRGEPDLTYQEKYEIAEKMLADKPFIFLTRFGRFLSKDDLLYFEALKKGDFMVDCQLKELRQNCDDRKNKTKVRNRRYEAMKEIMDKGAYFSDEEMKARDPLLYEQMVGQYLSEDEVKELVDKSDLRLSNILIKHMDIVQNNIVYDLQKQVEESQMEEEEEDDDDEDEKSEEEEEEEMDEGEKEEEKRPEISPEEKAMLRAEFLRTMQLRFLDGDHDFDYSNIDGNVAYDSLDIRERDEQEKYFDDDEATSMTSPLTSAAASNSSSASDLSFLSPSEFKKLKKLSDDLSPLTLGEPSRGSDANNTENTSGAPVSPSSEERSKKVDGGVAMSNDGDVATT